MFYILETFLFLYVWTNADVLLCFARPQVMYNIPIRGYINIT